MNYQNGKIYELCCIETGERYIGSCCTTLTKRLYAHKNKSNTCASKQIIERGNYEMTLLQDFPCDRKEQLVALERFYYDLLPNINRNRPIRLETDKEAIAKKSKEYQTEYKLANREKIAERGKEYNAINREQIVEQKKAYHLKNKDVLNLKTREYRQANLEIMREKDRLRHVLRSEKHVCECGGRYTTKTKPHHMNTQKHLSRSKPS